MLLKKNNFTGYQHKHYAESLAEFGRPLELKHSGAWVLERSIPGSDFKDVVGCYPLFSCREWTQLPLDIKEMEKKWVSFSLVTDPFDSFTETLLRENFMDVCFSYKKHFVLNLNSDFEQTVSSHHKRNVKKGIKALSVTKVEEPVLLLDRWMELYSLLIEKHHIKGIAGFSRDAFLKQMITPGLKMFKASYGNDIAGLVIFYEKEDTVYYHLGAYNETGYKFQASYAIFWEAIHYFKDKGFHWFNFGSGSGIQENQTDGLSRFKKGWASDTRTAYFCGKILNPEVYKELVETSEGKSIGFFPAYRSAL